MIRITRISATIIMIAGLLTTLLRCSTRSFGDLNQEMEYLVSGLVEKDKSVRNCVLSVMKRDGSFSWLGAAALFFLTDYFPYRIICQFQSKLLSLITITLFLFPGRVQDRVLVPRTVHSSF
jgi:hypothetical protein